MHKLRIPIYSMRSHIDNTYSILKDGNLKIHLCRMDLDNDYLVIPNNTKDLLEFINLNLIPSNHLIQAKYGINAVDTRDTFWINNLKLIDQLNLDIVTDITGYPGQRNFSNNFNITKLPNIKRSYIDKFFNSDIESIKKAEITTVLNQCQKDYIISLYPELEDKVVVNQKVISKEYFDKVGVEKIDIEIGEKTIFFPFRLSDLAYKFEQTVDKYKDYDFIITNPNDSYSGNYKNVKIIKPTKKQYYWILSQQPTIIYNENPELVFHPGLMDFIYFNCNIICPYNIPTLEDGLII